MKVREDKGITFIALILTFILLAIITSVSVSMGMNFMQSAKFENIETYLLLIQSKSKVMADKIAIGELDADEIRGEKQESGEYAGWYKLSQGDLNEIGVNKAKAEDGYYVNYENLDVAYERGITLDDILFNRLTEILNYQNTNKGKQKWMKKKNKD